MTYDSENLFSGIRLVSQEEMRETSIVNDKPIDDDTSNDDTTPIDMTTSSDYETTNDSPFSLVQPNREPGDAKTEDDSTTDIDNKVDDIEEEKDVDIKAQKYLALAKELQAEGILSEINEEEFDPSLDGLKKLFNDEKATRVQNEVENFKKSL